MFRHDFSVALVLTLGAIATPGRADGEARSPGNRKAPAPAATAQHSGDRTEDGTARASEKPDSDHGHMRAEGGPAPDFALPDLRGVVVDSAYVSRPVTVVHFWATWCVPCMREIPHLNRLAERYEPAGAAIYAVALGSGSPSELRQVEKTYHIRHRVLVGDERLAHAFGEVPSFPVTFLVDNRGRIIERHEGATREAHEKIEATIRGMLAASGRTLPPKE